MTDKPHWAFRVFLWLYVAAFVVDAYFQLVNGVDEWACIDFNGDGNPGVCIGMGAWE